MSFNKDDWKPWVKSTLNNYILAGLRSHMPDAKVRIFEMSRDPLHMVMPHSHRFGLYSVVLQGSVVNTCWSHYYNGQEETGNLFQASKLVYKGEPGQYEKIKHHTANYKPEKTTYQQGQSYYMDSSVIHSIEFSPDAQVLIIEGPTERDYSMILEPKVAGKVIPAAVEPWMFT